MRYKIKKTILVSVYAICFVAFTEVRSSGQNCQQPIDGQEQSDDKVIGLFNGLDFDGWYTFLQNRGRNNDPKNVFTVQDGMIRISGEEWGCITTHAEYENYSLVVEFKWGGLTFQPRIDKARDSGLLLHSQGEDGSSQGIWIHSIECQIIEGGTGDFIVVGDGSDQFKISSTVALEKQGNSFIFQPDGHIETIQQGRINWFGRDPGWTDVLGYQGKNDVENPFGEWNTVECIAEDGQLSIFLNGTLVNRATDVKPDKGRIQIQSEGAEIFFRRIDLILLHQ